MVFHSDRKIVYLCSSNRFIMVEINERLDKRYRMQQDGILETGEEQRIMQLAAGYSYTEGSLAVLSNLRTNVSHVFFGCVGEALGFSPKDGYMQIESVWEEEIFARIHPDDLRLRHLQELVFFLRMSTKTPVDGVFPWHFENTMRMKDKEGEFHKVVHRIFYFSGSGRKDVCYALCLYNFTSDLHEKARMANMETGEMKLIEVDDCRHLLSEREKSVLRLIRKGLASKEICEQLGISKHTVDRHRQNIIAKLQVKNSAEACHKAELLGLIE